MEPSNGHPTVSVLVPALNEQDTLREVIERLLALPISAEVIVIDDGSTDGTPAILAEFAGKIKVITNTHKSGKGKSIRNGLLVAEGEYVVIQDADLEYLPEQIAELLVPLQSGQSQIVYGTRFSNGFPSGMAIPNKIINKLLAWMTRLLYGQKITDEATCYKALSLTLVQQMELECTGFEFCPEVTAKASRLGQTILEVPISYIPRNKQAGKKIRWTDAPIAIWTLAKYRFWKPSR
ncbi:MAG: glycosyltransferase family 2 protein [Armatimonadetes bacterium]|nr:glycosyltransferase family 2 protein [Armatimonadota bacterium]